MILTNGRIYTMDPSVPRVSGLPITRDGRVARGVEAWEGDGSAVSNERIDLDGRTVLPGLVDAHVHFRSWALEQELLDLSGCATAAACAAAAAAAPEAGWLIGRGFREATFADGVAPTAALLDAAAPGRRIALWAHDRHTLWLSSPALAALAIGHDTAPPAGGVIERDTHGGPTGILREEAAWRAPLPAPDPAAARAAVERAQRTAHARGVTTVHDYEAHGGFAIWQELHGERRQTVRVCAAQRADRIGAVRATELRTGFGDDLLRVGPVKAFLDGTLGSRTARMLDPFPGGVEITTRRELEELIAAAAAGGLQVAVHAIGDGANRDALDAFAATRDRWSSLAAPPRIEHAQLLDAADTGRFAGIGIVASVQPSHAPSDREMADRLLGARTALRYPARSLLEAGATLAFGSDAPIEPLDPLLAIHAAVNRTLDERPPWHPEESIGIADAVAASTVGAARAAGWERRVGRLHPGLLADLVVLDDDPFTCPPQRLARIGVVATMVGGRWVHGRPPW